MTKIIKAVILEKTNNLIAMKKFLVIMLIFLGMFICQDTVDHVQSSQKSIIKGVVIDNQNSTTNDIVTSSHSPFYLSTHNWRVVIKILASFFIIVGFVFIFILIKVVKELIS